VTDGSVDVGGTPLAETTEPTAVDGAPAGGVCEGCTTPVAEGTCISPESISPFKPSSSFRTSSAAW
jgi:hypothetical protein